LGTIIGPHGVHGLLKIAAVTDFPERLCSPGIRHLKAPNRRSPREITLLEGRHRLKNEYLIKFEGVSERNEAVNLRGSVLYARQEERPKSIGENEYLVTELVGLEVRLVTGYGEDIKDIDDGADLKGNLSQENKDKNIGGRFVGTIQGVVLAEEMCSIPGLGQDLLEVVLPRGRHGTASWKDELVLIPLVPSIVTTVDIERRIIYINPPGGLLDLTYVREDNVRIKGFLPETSSYEQNKYK
jgi:16S rRNA processing protein RimM